MPLREGLSKSSGPVKNVSAGAVDDVRSASHVFHRDVDSPGTLAVPDDRAGTSVEAWPGAAARFYRSDAAPDAPRVASLRTRFGANAGGKLIKCRRAWQATAGGGCRRGDARPALDRPPPTATTSPRCPSSRSSQER